ncbi:MAG: hypothetical protein HDR21_03850 [Lachnospiraceae bacterium]|nr:hypothetical protein [Lachnospiraceae bacterium]MBD5482550.1 hypothetical protein [Lachnospiraceae bacterium]
MRITNKIMQNNSLRNINTNKELQSQLSIQMQTGNKLTRPSDDPVVAIRSLRLSTNLTKVTQYNEKNATDAESWMKATEDAIFAGEELIQAMYTLCNSSTSDDKNTANYQAALLELQQSAKEFYDTGDTDFGGRNVFTGYRTESKLQFQAGETLEYRITEEFTLKDLQTRTHINTKDPNNTNPDGDIFGYTEAAGFTVDETMVVPEEYTRFRLAYDDLRDFSDQIDPYVPIFKYPNPADPAADADGYVSLGLVIKNSTDPEAYTPDDDKAYLLADTGEVIFGKAVIDAMSALPNTTTFSIEYEKHEWVTGDLRPEHYFDCSVKTDKVDNGGNPVWLDYESGSKQRIEYDLGANQSLQVNTVAGEVYVHDVGRDVEDLEVAINQLAKLDDIVTSLEEKIASLSEGADLDAANLQLDAAKKAQSLVKDQVQKLFGSTMTSMKTYQDLVNLAGTNVGTRGARLDLIKNRLEGQQATFKELYINNNHKEIEDSTTELASAKLTYDAALSATAKILQTSLMNYI